MKAGVCLQLSNASDCDAWRRRSLIEAMSAQFLDVFRHPDGHACVPSKGGVLCVPVRQGRTPEHVLFELRRFWDELGVLRGAAGEPSKAVPLDRP